MVNIINVIKQAVTHPIQSFFAAGKPIADLLMKSPQQTKDTFTQLGLAALPVSGAGKAFSGTKSILSKTFNIVKKELTTTPINFGTKLKGAVLGTGLTAGALTLGKYAVTGKLQPPSGQSIAELFSLRMSPVGTIFGNIEGLRDVGGNKFMDIIGKNRSNFNIPNMSTPNINSITDGTQQNISDFIGALKNMQMPNNTTNITMLSPENPFNQMGLPSVSPSYSMSVGGGGMGEILPLMLLLGAGAGVGGYVLGRRKKKKYKKKRKHK